MDPGSRWTGVIVLAVAGLVGGLLYGRRVDPAVSAGADGSTGDPEVDALRTRVAELEDRVRQHEKLIAAYEEDLGGGPVPWPDEVEERFSPAGFTARAEAAFAECGIPGDLVAVDCAEAPCLMVVRLHEFDAMGELLTDCPAWSRHYLPITTGTQFEVTCPGGGAETVAVRGIPIATVLGLDPRTPGIDERERLDARTQRIRASWRCAGEE